MPRLFLKDHQWDQIKDLLPGKATDPGTTANNRLFIEAILWINRTGAPWRDIPEEFGNWHNLYNRYSRWCRKGVWERIFNELSKDCDLEYLMLDGSIIRVHQHGAAKKKISLRSPLGNPVVD